MRWDWQILLAIVFILMACGIYACTFIPYSYISSKNAFITPSDFDVIRWNMSGVVDLLWILAMLLLASAWCGSRAFDFMSYLLKWIVIFAYLCKQERVITNLICDGEMFWWEWLIYCASLIVVIIKAVYDIRRCSSLR